MLESLHVSHFQSLHDVALPLGRFTVIVGRTDSGKSAFIRALRTLTSNARGDGFITRGHKLTTITATTPAHTVTLTRGTTNAYTITPHPTPTDPTPAPQSFTKLNGTTPAAVSEALGIPSGSDPINYAGQFDTPYLLKASAPDTARTLGELTNVRIIFDAARESNRRRLQASTTHKTRLTDLDGIRAKASAYAPLQGQLAAIAEAEHALTTARELQARLARLTHALDALDTLTHRLATITPLAALTVPSLDAATEAHSRLTAYARTIDGMRAAAQALTAASARETEHTTALVTLADDYVSALTTAGVCPTCGQGTHDLTAVHHP